MSDIAFNAVQSMSSKQEWGLASAGPHSLFVLPNSRNLQVVI